MQKILGHFHRKDPNCKQELLKAYLKYSKLDGKPEKGERKIADDFVLILDELLAEASAKEPRNNADSLNTSDLFRIGILEYAL